jgi:hypothetical protein
MTIGIDIGDVWSHYYMLNEDGGVVPRQNSIRGQNGPGSLPLMLFGERCWPNTTVVDRRSGAGSHAFGSGSEVRGIDDAFAIGTNAEDAQRRAIRARAGE